MKEIKEEIIDLENPNSSFYGEWVFFENDKEKQDAFDYLALWKKFILKKLKGMEQVGHDHMILRPNINDTNMNTLGIKIEMRPCE